MTFYLQSLRNVYATKNADQSFGNLFDFISANSKMVGEYKIIKEMLNSI